MSDSDQPYGWLSTFAELQHSRTEDVTSALAAFVRDAGSEQHSAWLASVGIVRDVAARAIALEPSAAHYSALFEYELPREGGRRPDVVVLENGHILVLEFKGKPAPLRADLDQVAAYARDLRYYHSECRGREVQPVLVPTKYTGPRRLVEDVEVCAPAQLVELVEEAGARKGAAPLEPDSWARGEYEPLPSLVGAARDIFVGRPLPFIKRAQSAGIPQALQRLSILAHLAAKERRRALVLLTGVPGAGKTLVGLQFVHLPGLEDLRVEMPGRRTGAPAVFLSGNGPLVEVLRHALRGPAGEEKIFVQGIKQYLKQHLLRKRPQPPPEHIIVFDEAQRAWDTEQIKEKHEVDASEPELIVRLAESIPNWSLVLGLIGEGQEIHKGEEAGLGQWASAVAAAAVKENWMVAGPDRLEALFGSHGIPYEVCPELDLTVSLRSHLSSAVSTWVTRLLSETDLDPSPLRELSDEIRREGFKMYVTRNLGLAADYVRRRYEGQALRRFGLLASARARNLTVLGVDNSYQATKQLKPGPWFNDPPNSPFSCCALQTVATEFQCQGLELDLPIVCWGDDLTWTTSGWLAAKRKLAAAYRNPGILRINSYRVLLTRGRDGMIIFVPPDMGDGMDAVAERLEKCGLDPLTPAISMNLE